MTNDNFPGTFHTSSVPFTCSSELAVSCTYIQKLDSQVSNVLKFEENKVAASLLNDLSLPCLKGLFTNILSTVLQGTSTRGAGDPNSRRRGPRLTAP